MSRAGNPLTDTFRSRGCTWRATIALSLLLAAAVGTSFKLAASTGAPAAGEATPESSRREHAALAADIDTCESAERRKRLVRTCIDQGALRRQWGSLAAGPDG